MNSNEEMERQKIIRKALKKLESFMGRLPLPILEKFFIRFLAWLSRFSFDEEREAESLVDLIKKNNEEAQKGHYPHRYFRRSF